MALAGATDPAPSQPLSVVAVNGAGTEVGHAVVGAYGTLTLNADGSYSYTATANSAALPDGGGEDNFTFTVSDRNGNTTTATLSILVASADNLTLAGNPSPRSQGSAAASHPDGALGQSGGHGGGKWKQAYVPRDNGLRPSCRQPPFRRRSSASSVQDRP